MTPMPAPIPLEAFLAADGISPNPESDLPLRLRQADLIFGVDVMSGNQCLVYGRMALEKICTTGKAMPLAPLRIAIDMESDELEKLLALVTVVRGHHDYD